LATEFVECFFFSSRRRHTRSLRDWSSDVCSSDLFKPQSRPPSWLANYYGQLEAFRIVNGYGLFRVMTKDRDEIVIEGSANAIDWLPYEFKWKPGDVKRPPGWCAPHQSRLDWHMWCAA